MTSRNRMNFVGNLNKPFVTPLRRIDPNKVIEASNNVTPGSSSQTGITPERSEIEVSTTGSSSKSRKRLGMTRMILTPIVNKPVECKSSTPTPAKISNTTEVTNNKKTKMEVDNSERKKRLGMHCKLQSSETSISTPLAKISTPNPLTKTSITLVNTPTTTNDTPIIETPKIGAESADEHPSPHKPKESKVKRKLLVDSEDSDDSDICLASLQKKYRRKDIEKSMEEAPDESKSKKGIDNEIAIKETEKITKNEVIRTEEETKTQKLIGDSEDSDDMDICLASLQKKYRESEVKKSMETVLDESKIKLDAQIPMEETEIITKNVESRTEEETKNRHQNVSSIEKAKTTTKKKRLVGGKIKTKENQPIVSSTQGSDSSNKEEKKKSSSLKRSSLNNSDSEDDFQPCLIKRRRIIESDSSIKSGNSDLPSCSKKKGSKKSFSQNVSLKSTSSLRSASDDDFVDLPNNTKVPSFSSLNLASQEEEDLEPLRNEVNELYESVEKKKKQLEALNQAVIYRKKHDVNELEKLTLKWKKGAQDGLLQLHRVLNQTAPITMEKIICKLGIPEEEFIYDPETETFK